jgi:NADH-quinone oxidoreductase subunit G
VGLTHEFATPERLVAALRAVGFDKVFDTDFGADLTIMEEGSEFVEFMKDPDAPRPMFTSCCPGWVRFVNMHYPQFVSRLSSSKSPHQMLGAVIKNTLHDEAEAAGKRIFNVSIMPCVAKKYECSVPELSTVVGAHGEAGARLDLEAELTPDVDAVLTVREFNRLLRMMGINCAALPEEEFDSPLGQSTGAATIFGRTGGVMEAALRTAAFLMTGEKPTIEMCDQRDATPDRPWTSKELNINGSIVRIGVASGLENTSKLLEAIDAGEVEFDFVEIMACPGGCVGGGGQPIEFNKELHAGRARILNTIDNNMPLRYSHENSDIQRLYAEWIGEPCNHVAHDWLHTNQLEWTMPGRKTACSSQSE